MSILQFIVPILGGFDILTKMASSRGGEVADEVNEKIYIAVSKDWKACKSALEWVVRNSKGKGLCLVHVHQPAQFISICECQIYLLCNPFLNSLIIPLC